jgi:hypothetical protein
MRSYWSGIVSVGRGGYTVVVGQKGTDAQDWRLALAAGFERRQTFDLGNRLRLCGFCRVPDSQPVAIVAYDESVH